MGSDEEASCKHIQVHQKYQVVWYAAVHPMRYIVLGQAKAALKQDKADVHYATV